MTKYVKVLSTTCALLIALGLVGCKNYTDQIDELAEKNAELATKLEKVEADLKKSEEEQNKTQAALTKNEKELTENKANLEKTEKDLKDNKAELEKVQKELAAEQLAARKRSYAKFLRENSKILLDQNYKYTSPWGTEEFIITSDGDVNYTSNGTAQMKGTLVGAEIPTGYTGIILYVLCDTHINYGNYCYPDYNENTWEGSVVDQNNYGAITHKGCYSAFYVTDADDATGSKITMAQAVWHPANEPNGRTACTNSTENLKKLFTECGYASTCGSYATNLSRSAFEHSFGCFFSIAE